MNRRQRLRWHVQRNFIPLTVSIAVAVGGAVFMMTTWADTPLLIMEPEEGLLSGLVSAYNDETASGNQAVAFGNSSPAGSGFVTRNGTDLQLDGEPYRFTGVNIYNANSINNFWYTLGEGPGLANALTDIDAGTGGNAKVMRAWFGQLLLKPRNNTIDWSVFDHTISVAKAHGYKVIVTLSDQGTLDNGEVLGFDFIYKTVDWYESRYRTEISDVVSPWGAGYSWTYKDYVGQVVERYKDEPAILMWQLMNEAEPKLADGSCSTAISLAGAQALRSFADDMGAYIKSIDPNHLVSLGTIGTGQCGTDGPHYHTVHASPGIDICEMHDYVPDQDIIGDQWNGMQLRIDQCNDLNKPMFVGEAGIDPTAVDGLQARADRFSAKISAQFAQGVDGFVVWEWRDAGQTGGDNFVFGPGDPMLDALNLSHYID